MKTHSHTQASADTSDHFTKNKCTKKSLTSKKKMWQVIRAGSICPIFQVVRISSVHTHPDPDCAASRSSFFKGDVFWYYEAPQGPISSSGARFQLRGPALNQVLIWSVKEYMTSPELGAGPGGGPLIFLIVQCVPYICYCTKQVFN